MSEQDVNPDPRRCTCHPDDHPPVPCQEKYALTECRVAALVEAMDQLLNDMGPHGLCVCNAAKAQARIALEPFRDPALTKDYDDYYMTLAEAQRVAREAGQ